MPLLGLEKNMGPHSGISRGAAFLAFVGVALGAFGAHGLRARLGDTGLEIWRTATLYHLVHAVALLAVGLAFDRLRTPRPVAALFAVGIVIFSGTLYLLALGGPRWLGAITPVGGASFMAAWLTLALTGVRR